jgi:UDP-GlcNAc:undecaprenyl-phosphate/decaprenyl-phosphate GlcNAc-1-phosphate transferase
MLDVMLTGSVAFIITFLAIPIVMQIADKKKLYDIPDERKIHTRLVPSLGGVGIFAGFFLSVLLSVHSEMNPEFQYYFAAAFVIFFLGLKDDLIILSAMKKFIGQVVAAAILIHLADLRITSMHGLLGLNELPEAFSLALSYLTIIVVINSFNLIDGVDGLAGTLTLLTMIVFGIYFFAIDMAAYSILSFGLAGSLVAFLIFNHNPAKIFMGDSGSLMAGLINSILVIKFISVADSPAIAVPVASTVAVAFAILIVPLLDTLRVFTIRIFRGNSPFTPDRNHVHHLLLDRGMSHTAVTLTCAAINIFFIAFAWTFRSWGPTYIILAMLVLSFAGFAFLYYTRKQRPGRMVVAKVFKTSEQAELITSSKLISLSKEKVASDQ